jgi:hypothetical protein
MLARAVAGCSAVTVALVALQSCTAVLGMERATLEVSTDGAVASGSAGGSGNLTSKYVPCTERPSSDCVACLNQNCTDAYSNCILDHACRASLDQYALCLGARCNGTVEQCATATLPSGSPLVDCLSTCETQCTGTALATSCDLFCGCMPSCDTQAFHAADPDTPVLTGAACMAQCKTDSAKPGFVECLRSHCEFGNGRVVHCEHATNAQPVCDNLGPPKGPGICLAAKEDGWYCEKSSECCSKNCATVVTGGGSCKAP